MQGAHGLFWGAKPIVFTNKNILTNYIEDSEEWNSIIFTSFQDVTRNFLSYVSLFESGNFSNKESLAFNRCVKTRFDLGKT